jgi:hypothetical protein
MGVGDKILFGYYLCGPKKRRQVGSEKFIVTYHIVQGMGEKSGTGIDIIQPGRVVTHHQIGGRKVRRPYFVPDVNAEFFEKQHPDYAHQHIVQGRPGFVDFLFRKFFLKAYLYRFHKKTMMSRINNRRVRQSGRLSHLSRVFSAEIVQNIKVSE